MWRSDKPIVHAVRVLLPLQSSGKHIEWTSQTPEME